MIENRRETLSWTPEGERKSYLFLGGISKHGILLSRVLRSKPSIDAFYCDKCKKIIIDVPEDNE